VNVSSEVASLTTITDPSSGMYGMFDMAYPASKAAVNMATTEDGPTGEYWGSLFSNEAGVRSVAPW
jgi:hypothetical protein